MLYADRIRRQIQVLGHLPEPSLDAIDHSEQLYRHLKKQLIEQPLPFYNVMDQILHAPALGYYSAGSDKIGDAGLSVSGYTNQASFLTGCGILQMAETAAATDMEK